MTIEWKDMVDLQRNMMNQILDSWENASQILNLVHYNNKIQVTTQNLALKKVSLKENEDLLSQVKCLNRQLVEFLHLECHVQVDKAQVECHQTESQWQKQLRLIVTIHSNIMKEAMAKKKMRVRIIQSKITVVIDSSTVTIELSRWEFSEALNTNINRLIGKVVASQIWSNKIANTTHRVLWESPKIKNKSVIEQDKDLSSKMKPLEFIIIINLDLKITHKHKKVGFQLRILETEKFQRSQGLKYKMVAHISNHSLILNRVLWR